MGALTLGLIAAFCWGLHDICVRRVSQNTPLMACLLMVLVAGSTLQTIIMAATDGFEPISQAGIWYAALAGVFFLIASLGLYGAFQRGPVRLVSPIIASYPILSVAWAVLIGTYISALDWVAVLTIIVGVSVVAILSDTSQDESPPKGPTIFYSIVAAVGFAGTFAIGQWAAAMGAELVAILITRTIATVLLIGIMVAKSLPFWPGRRAIPVLVTMGCLDGIALICVLSAGDLPNAQYASVASSIFGLLTIVMAWAFLKERMTLLQWFGVALSFAGIGYLAT